MPQAAIVNPRRRRRAPAPARRRRRRSFGSLASPRRSRRRATRRRRRNPEGFGEVGEVGDLGRRRYRRRTSRRRNPAGVFDFGALIDTAIPAGLGMLGARWVTHIAGEMKDNKPGFSHAIALWLAAQWGAPMIGQLLGSQEKGRIAAICALGFGADLFARKYWLEESDFFKENVYLKGDDDAAAWEPTDEELEMLEGVAGLTEGSAIAGLGADYMTPDGQVFSLSDYADFGARTRAHRAILADAGYAGLTEGSALAGRRVASGATSFGYVNG